MGIVGDTLSETTVAAILTKNSFNLLAIFAGSVREIPSLIIDKFVMTT